MFRRTLLYSLVMCLSLSSAVYADAKDGDILVVKIRKTIFKNQNEQVENYKYKLLELLLDKTKSEYGDYRIELTDIPSQKRGVMWVVEGKLDVLMTATTPEREREMIPIRIPIYKGLYGYRIFLINRSDKDKFDAIKTESDLKKLVAGQGVQWPDYKILKSNGYKVIGPSKDESLYDMLEARRFDYFPRGVHEPWLEIKQHPDKDFMIEEKLCISYPLPGYIFVDPKNIKLAERLKKGFIEAINDGSFDHLFYNHPDIKETLEKAKLDERMIFYMKNPLLTKETPLNIAKYWYKP